MERNGKLKTLRSPGLLRSVRKTVRCLRIWANSRRGAPILLGICLGVLLADRFQTKYRISEVVPVKIGDAVVTLPPPLSLAGEDYEPAVLIDNRRIPPAVQNAPHPVRPRYYASELGMHETLYVAVASSAATLPTLGVALNRTTAHHLPRLTFFINSVTPSLWTQFQNLSINIVRSSALTAEQMHPALMLRYIAENYVQTFDWFFIAPDSAYIRGSELLNTVKEISVGRPVYLGVPASGDQAGYCDFAAGILISQAVMRDIAENLPWCMEQAILPDFSASIGKCVAHTSHLQCATHPQLTSFRISNTKVLDSQDTTSELIESEEMLPGAVSIHPMLEPKHFYRLHLELSQRKIAESEEMIEELQEDIVKQSPHTPGGGKDLQWPIGINSPAVPKGRFDVIEWTYFNQTHLFRPDDFRVAVRLVGSHLKSIQQVVAFARKNIEERNAKQEVKVFGDIQLRNGYVKFDPTRGIEYLLDMTFQTVEGGEEVVKTLRILRALGQMEQISLPFVTENSRVHLTLSIVPSDIPTATAFLKTFAQVHLDAQDNVFFMLVLLYGPNDPGRESSSDVFGTLKSEAKEINKKYFKSLGTRLGWISIRNPLTVPPSEFAILDLVAKKFSRDSIIFRCNVNMTPSIDLLNRVRLSTIPGTQVYFPIPFVQYKPEIIYQHSPYPEDFDIKRQFGHFDRNSVDFAAFYVSDYTKTRKNISENWPLVNDDRDLSREHRQSIQTETVHDLYSLFLNTNLHIFRGVEPALKVKFTLLKCDEDAQLDKRLHERCEARLLNSLANKQQLALYVAAQQEQGKEIISTGN